jgi:hypothetical protein
VFRLTPATAWRLITIAASVAAAFLPNAISDSFRV